MSEGYLRHLLSEEIADLEMNGCTADNWENIKVASPFHAEHVCNVHFQGVWHWVFLKRNLLFREG